MRCPRCSDLTLIPAVGALGEDVCGGCGGRFLTEATAARLLFEERGLDREELVEQARGGVRGGECPACRSAMSALDAVGHPLSLCLGCGGVWMPEGSLAGIAEGRHPEINASVALPTAVGVVADERLDPARVSAAFARAGFRGAADANGSACSSHGLVVTRVSGPIGQTLVHALRAEGVSARLVDPRALELPRLLHARELVVEADGLRCLDNRTVAGPVVIPWQGIELAAAGQLRFTDVRTDETTIHVSLGNILGRRQRPLKLHSYEKREQSVLDLVHADGRVRVTPSHVHLERRPGVTNETLFRTLVRDMLGRLPATCRLVADAQSLSVDSMARLHPHLPAHWERLIAWELWRERTEP